MKRIWGWLQRQVWCRLGLHVTIHDKTYYPGSTHRCTICGKRIWGEM